MTIALLGVSLCAGGAAVGGEPKAAFTPRANEALVVFHTRVSSAINIPEGQLIFRPYDRATGRIGPAKDGFAVGRWIGLVSNAKMQKWKGWAMPIPPGSYVLASVRNPNLAAVGDDMLSRSWAFEVQGGTVTYPGDFVLQFERLQRGFGLDVLTEVDEPRARQFLAAKKPTQAPLVTTPLRPVMLSRDGPDGQWVVSAAK